MAENQIKFGQITSPRRTGSGVVPKSVIGKDATDVSSIWGQKTYSLSLDDINSKFEEVSSFTEDVEYDITSTNTTLLGGVLDAFDPQQQNK